MTQTHITSGGQEQGGLEERGLVQTGGGAGRDGQGCGQVRTLGQTAGLVGRWPVEKQACDAQSSGRHPQTAGIGAFSKTESGFPGKNKEKGDDDQIVGKGREETYVPMATYS